MVLGFRVLGYRVFGLTWTLQCNSFLGLVWVLVRTLIRTTKKVLHWRV